MLVDAQAWSQLISYWATKAAINETTSIYILPQICEKGKCDTLHFLLLFFSLDRSHPAIFIADLLISLIGFLQPSLQDKSYKHTRQKVQKAFNVMVVAYLVFS